YGLLIFFYNFIDLVISDTQNLKNIILEIIVKENNPALVEKILGDLHGYQRLSDRDRKILNYILKNSDYRKQFVDNIKKHLSAELIYQLSPINFIQQIDHPIFLIHGDKDPVISPKSTTELFQKISSNGISDFLISDLLSHGDVSPSKIIYNLFSLLSIFTRFFTYTQ
ncbi:MAG: alpha/beta hydrolase family protein, partial [Microcystis sp.]